MLSLEASFVSQLCSPEVLLDKCAQEWGGCAHKVLIPGDANPVRVTWTKTVYGERVGRMFSQLYDCEERTQSSRAKSIRRFGRLWVEAWISEPRCAGLLRGKDHHRYKLLSVTPLTGTGQRHAILLVHQLTAEHMQKLIC